MNIYESKDMELYYKWKETHDPRDLSNLIDHMSRLMNMEVNKHRNQIPEGALKGFALQQAVQAIERYDPSKGVKLSTWLVGYLSKVRRMNYENKDMARMGESKQQEYKYYSKALEDLREELDREPTDLELANRITENGRAGWNTATVADYKRQLLSEVNESAQEFAPKHSGFQAGALELKYVLRNLNPQETAIFNSRQTKLSTKDNAKALGMNTNKYNYSVKKLSDKIARLRKDLNLWEG